MKTCGNRPPIETKQTVSDSISLVWPVTSVETAPLVFQEVDGHATLVAREDDQGRITHALVSSFPPFAFIKLKFSETLAAIVFLWVLKYWNLLGYHFG